MIMIYTDGAASNNGYEDAIGGYGWVIQLPKEKPIIFGGRVENATNNQMELTAMISALSAVQGWLDRGEVFCNTEIYVYTDSAYISNCYIQKWYLNWKRNGWVNSKGQPVANKEQWEVLIPFFQRPDIHIVKVKGHSNNLGNQIADKIAVAARTLDVFNFRQFMNDLREELEVI